MFNHRGSRFRANRYFARLQRFGYFTHEIDDQKAVGHVCIYHMDMVGELKPTFEVPARNAHVQEITIIIAFSLLAACYN